jgi:glycosyltransferase involved in cell wall biosynthesis
MTGFMSSNRLVLIPSNVDTSLFRKYYEQKQYSKRKIEVLFVAGLYPFRKGILDILKAIPFVIEKNKNISFLFTGGDNVKSVIPKCNEMGITSYVKFLGWVSEEKKLKLYGDSDILILPSYDEGLPYVIIEALASGLPIISTYVGGIPEAVENGTNGFLINPGDYRALAEKILLLSQNKNLRQSIAKANIKKAETQYNKHRAMETIQLIYENLN